MRNCGRANSQASRAEHTMLGLFMRLSTCYLVPHLTLISNFTPASVCMLVLAVYRYLRVRRCGGERGIAGHWRITYRGLVRSICPRIWECFIINPSYILAVAGGNKNLAFKDGHGIDSDSDGVRTLFESKS